MGLEPMSATAAAATRSVRVRSLLTREEVASLTARLERLPLQPYTSCAEDVEDDNGATDECNGGRVGTAVGTAVHVTKYVNTAGIFSGRFRGVRRRVLAVAAAASAREGWGGGGRCWRRGCGWRPRVCEYHEYQRGGRLAEEGHTDVGSLVTVDIMLEEVRVEQSRPGSILCHTSVPTLDSLASSQLRLVLHVLVVNHPRRFCGDAYDSQAAEGGELTVGGRAVPRFRAGDAVVFVSAVVHGVRPVIRGRRRVLAGTRAGAQDRPRLLHTSTPVLAWR
jgi:hypothetical protein